MFEFLIDTLKGESLLADLENIGACYPDDDVIYVFGNPCRLSSARPTPRAGGQLPLCPECGETLLEDDRRWECVNESCGNCR
jgi:hypothetical protein